MTTAEKKRILNTDNVTGEVVIRTKKLYNKKIILPFERSNVSVLKIGNESNITGKNKVFVSLEENYLELWEVFSNDIYLKLKLKYSEIDIVFCKYECNHIN